MSRTDFAEDAGKADQYTTPDAAYDDGNDLHDMLYPGGKGYPDGGPVYYMFVCKVVLGHILHTKQRARDNPNAFASRANRELTYVPGSSDVHYHTLLGDMPGLRYREWVNFHGEYVYPEYLIAYTRSSS